MAVYYETNQVICNQFDIVCNEKVYFADIFCWIKGNTEQKRLHFADLRRNYN